MKKLSYLSIPGNVLRYFWIMRLGLIVIALPILVFGLFELKGAQAQVRYDDADENNIKIRCKYEVKDKAKNSMHADAQILHAGYLVEVKGNQSRLLVVMSGKAYLSSNRENTLSDFVKVVRYFYACHFAPDGRGGWHIQKVEIYPCRCRKGFFINGKRY